MTKILLVAGALMVVLVGGCVTEADRRAEDVAACQAIGFQAGTTEMRDCLLRLTVARRSHLHHR